MNFFSILVGAMVASSYAAIIRAKREYIGNNLSGRLSAVFPDCGLSSTVK